MKSQVVFSNAIETIYENHSEFVSSQNLGGVDCTCCNCMNFTVEFEPRKARKDTEGSFSVFCGSRLIQYSKCKLLSPYFFEKIYQI